MAGKAMCLDLGGSYKGICLIKVHWTIYIYMCVVFLICALFYNHRAWKKKYFLNPCPWMWTCHHTCIHFFFYVSVFTMTLLLLVFFFFGDTGVWTQGFTLAILVLYHLSHAFSPPPYLYTYF
jgi:hypothetical protein